MLIIDFTATLSPDGDFIIPADILQELGLDGEDTLSLIYLQAEEGDCNLDDLEVNVIEIEINTNPDRDKELDIFAEIGNVLDELDCLHHKVDKLLKMVPELLMGGE